mgnify:CR=1 FL=1
MMTTVCIIRTPTNCGTQHVYRGSNGRRGYLGAGLFGTVCESNILRHITSNPNAKAPEDWPMRNPSLVGRMARESSGRFDRELAEINAENPNL